MSKHDAKDRIISGWNQILGALIDKLEPTGGQVQILILGQQPMPGILRHQGVIDFYTLETLIHITEEPNGDPVRFVMTFHVSTVMWIAENPQNLSAVSALSAAELDELLQRHGREAG